jgi:hypothetical protein
LGKYQISAWLVPPADGPLIHPAGILIVQAPPLVAIAATSKLPTLVAAMPAIVIEATSTDPESVCTN